MSSRASSEMALAISMICWSAIERPRAGRRGSMCDAEPGEERLGLGVHRRPVDAATGAERLAAHEDVLGDRQVGEERRLLVDDRDARGLGLRGRAEVDRLAVEQQLAAVAAVHAGDDLDQRRLAGAVLADEGVDRARRAPRGRPERRATTGAEGLRDVAQLAASGRRWSARSSDVLDFERFQSMTTDR